MNVLSLFDGMSCGQQALEWAKIDVQKYYASEIDRHAIKVTQSNYPNTIQLGSVLDVDVSKLDKIDLLIGGSPCQSFSFAGKRKGMSTKCETEIYTLEHYLELRSEGYEFEGQSYLFWEYMRILTDIRKYNPNVKFLLENVMMGKKWENILTRSIEVSPIEINSALVSAQNRRRLYWTNIGMVNGGLFGFPTSIIQQPKDKGILLKDILEDDVDEKYFLSEKMIETITRHNNEIINSKQNPKQSGTIHAGYFKMGGRDQQYIIHNLMPRSSKSGKGGTGHLSREDGKTYCLDTGNTNAVEINAVMLGRSEQFGHIERKGYKPYTLCKGETHGVRKDNKIRRLTPIECERLQTVRDGYTSIVSDSQRYKMLGNGWTVDVIVHIFKYLTNDTKES